jgi:hypothetical protein
MGTAKVERRPFFIVEKWCHNGRRHSYCVMSESEIMRDESVMMASGDYDTRVEAERALKQGIADGTYHCGSH